MRKFILEVVIFTLISMLCFSVYGQGWQDEEHVWNEDKGRFEVHNKAVVPAQPNRDMNNDRFIPQYTEEWARYLPKTVRYGKRAATSWEISEAQRKLWAKEILTVRAMKKAEQRRQLIAYRKASGWYAARRSGAHSYGNSLLRAHVMSVNNYMYRSRGYGY